MYRKQIILLLVITLLFSCGRHANENVFILKDERPYHVLKESRVYEDLALQPSKVLVRDSLLILLDGSPEGKLKIYDMATDMTVSFVNQGRAKGEVLGAFDIDYLSVSNDVAILDITNSHILMCSLDSIYVEGYYPTRTFNIASSGYSLVTSFAVADSLVYLTGCFDDARIIKLDVFDQALESKAVYFPNLKDDKLDRFVNQAYMGTMAFNPNLNKCAIGCRYADQLEIYDFDNDSVKFVKGPLLFEPLYKIVNTHQGYALAHSDAERKGYVHVASDDDFIYALYSGRTMPEGNSAYGKEIRKFTWNGEYVEAYMLERYILSFDISPDGHFYAVSHDGDVVRYDLNSV